MAMLPANSPNGFIKTSGIVRSETPRRRPYILWIRIVIDKTAACCDQTLKNSFHMNIYRYMDMPLYL